MDMNKVYVVIILMFVMFINFVTYQTIMIQVKDMRRRLNDIEFKLMKKDVIKDE